MNLIPIDEAGPCREGTVSTNYSTICSVVGFEENVDDDPDKVEASWGFQDKDTGRKAYLWCYRTPKKFCRDWSAAGDFTLLKELFPGKVRVES